MVSGSVKRILGNSLIVLLIVLLIIFVLQYYEYDLFYFNILLMTLLYLFIFKIILFLVYHSYVLGLVRYDLYTCLGSCIDSYIVPLSCIGLAEQHYYRGVIAMFLIFLANITMHGRSLVSQ